jgi:hypothetical protein
VKKVWLVVALVALAGGLATKTYADVQNIRLSGDIRVRGYWLNNVGGDTNEDQLSGSDSYISQRTRVSVEADLEDNVLVVVTLKAEGLWGGEQGSFDNFNEQTSGAGSVNGRGEVINRGFDVGINEAYVQLNEAFYSPLTAKLGRQYLHYGRGLIISSLEQEYNFDAARLVLDYHPLVVDLVYAALLENSPFGSGGTANVYNNDLHMLFANARYEMADSPIKSIEGYFGYLINSQPLSAATRVPPSVAGGSPMIVGARAELEPLDGLALWGEGAYEWGPDGVASATEDISAYILNAGGTFGLKNVAWSPVLNASYIYASGGGANNEHAFRPWFDYMDGYNGMLFSPLLSNIHVFNLGASVKPCENTTVSLQGYYYRQADTVPGNPGIGLIGNGNIDNGGVGYSPSGSSHEIGYEFDAIIGYDYSKDVSLQLVYAAFIPDNAFTVYSSDSVAHEIRGEVNVRF